MGTIASGRTVGSSKVLSGGPPRRIIEVSSQFWACLFAGLALLIVGVVTAGWTFDIHDLRALVPDLIEMKLSSALCLALLAGAILAFLFPGHKGTRRTGQILAALTALLGMCTLTEYALNQPFSITAITIDNGTLLLDYTKRMAPITAVAFCLGGLALVMIVERRCVNYGQILAGATAEIGLVTLTAYLYGATEFYGSLQHYQMPVPTALGFIFIGAGALFLRPHKGLMRVFFERDAGGHMARNLLPVAIIVPLFIGWLRQHGQELNLYDDHTGIALMAMASVTVMGYVIYRTACKLSQSDKERIAAEFELREYQSHLEELIAERTERLERSQEQLRQSQKLEAIGTLAGGIAHDFNNILGAIIGYGEMVLERLRPGSEEELDQREVLHAARRATELVRQILTFSRKNHGQRVPVDVTRIVKEVAKLLRASLPSTIAIHWHLDAAHSTVQADPIEVHQVLMNLCTNAAAAMQSKGGLLEVRLRDYHNEEEDGGLIAGEYLLLSVSDTGIGMDGELQQRIFEPFFTTKEVGQGTGLGLSTVHGIVSDLGGRIGVYSEPGNGTTFNVYLPLTKDRAGTTAAPHAAQGQGTILFVDDEAPLARAGKLILERYGYVVDAYSNVAEALDAFTANPGKYELLISDQTMPGMTGTQLAEQVHALCPELPVILCTGFTLKDSELSSVAVKVLAKPLDSAHLTGAVREVLTGLAA